MRYTAHAQNYEGMVGEYILLALGIQSQVVQKAL